MVKLNLTTTPFATCTCNADQLADYLNSISQQTAYVVVDVYWEGNCYRLVCMDTASANQGIEATSEKPEDDLNRV